MRLTRGEAAFLIRQDILLKFNASQPRVQPPASPDTSSNSGSPCRIARSGSRRAHDASLNPASHALRNVSSASGFLFSRQYVHAALYKNRSFVGAQRHGQIQFAQRVFRPVRFPRSRRPAKSALAHLRALVSNDFPARRSPAVSHVASRFLFSHRAQRVHDRHIYVVILAARFNRRFRHVHHFLIASRRKKRPAQQIIRAFAISLALDRFLHHAHRFVVHIGGVQNPRLAHLHFRQIPAQRHGFARSVRARSTHT